MLFSVRGKFANNFTFSVNPVDAATPQHALAQVYESEDVKTYAADNNTSIAMVTVRALSGRKSRVKISDKPAAERKGGGRKRAASAPTTSAPASGGRKNR